MQVVRSRLSSPFTMSTFAASVVALAALLLAGCASKPASEMPEAMTQAAPAADDGAATPTPKPAPRSRTARAAQPAGKPADSDKTSSEPEDSPLRRNEITGQCWMKYDHVAASLEKKADLVGQCVEARMKGGKEK